MTGLWYPGIKGEENLKGRSGAPERDEETSRYELIKRPKRNGIESSQNKEDNYPYSLWAQSTRRSPEQPPLSATKAQKADLIELSQEFPGDFCPYFLGLHQYFLFQQYFLHYHFGLTDNHYINCQSTNNRGFFNQE